MCESLSACDEIIFWMEHLRYPQSREASMAPRGHSSLLSFSSHFAQCALYLPTHVSRAALFRCRIASCRLVGDEPISVLPNEDYIAIYQHMFLHRSGVHVATVGAAEIFENDGARPNEQLRMPAAHQIGCDLKIVLGRAPNGQCAAGQNET